MNREHTQSIKIFYSYAHKDEGMRDELDNHIGRDGVTAWHDRNITAGTEWLIEINKNLDTADIILLLISANYLSSVPCNEEMKRALARRSRGEAIVIPVILSPVALERLAPLKGLQFLPPDGKPELLIQRQLDSIPGLPLLICPGVTYTKEWQRMIEK